MGLITVAAITSQPVQPAPPFSTRANTPSSQPKSCGLPWDLLDCCCWHRSSHLCSSLAPLFGLSLHYRRVDHSPTNAELPLPSWRSDLFDSFFFRFCYANTPCVIYLRVYAEHALTLMPSHLCSKTTKLVILLQRDLPRCCCRGPLRVGAPARASRHNYVVFFLSPCLQEK
ncbi:hypothetical protein B0H63DRAFT_207795 [Podospora didyma]|uniref:Uncharacterized protein n=1 Tax=Podospora didyma TaxID=330526 RepID=A0AAE0NHE7_9PEZI|nr:hypothetical protein B0H63DRAFT_207795 [Podospora didyma]